MPVSVTPPWLGLLTPPAEGDAGGRRKDLARHAKGMWASPVELDEWYALWTTFYVGDDAYMALKIESGVIE